MRKFDLATELRHRLRRKKLVSSKKLGHISDAAIIDSYNKCSCCGTLSVPDVICMDKIIESSRDVEHFLDQLEARSHGDA